MAAPTNKDWVQYNPMTSTYDTRDGTAVPAEIVDTVQCIADLMKISNIRETQRESMKQNDVRRSC